MKRLLVLAALACAPTPALAADDCAALDTTQAGLNECYGKAYAATDAQLNGVYKLINHRLAGNPDAAGKLVAAQRAWIAFRDAECAFTASEVEGGSAQPMVELQCKEALTRQRVAGLKSYLNCDEGDLACPVPKPQ